MAATDGRAPLPFPGAVAAYGYDYEGADPSHVASASVAGVAASTTASGAMSNGADLILVNAGGRRSSADSRGNDAAQIEMHIRRLSGSASRPAEEPPSHVSAAGDLDGAEYDDADGVYDPDGEQGEKGGEDDPYGQMMAAESGYDADGTARHTGLKRVYWADENGLALYEVYYSDKLHYSPQYSYEEAASGGQCCTIM